MYQALRLIRDGEMVQDGKFPFFIVEPLFGAADLELQLQIEDNYDFDYSYDGFHYQQEIHVRGTPLREGSRGFLFKKTETFQRVHADGGLISESTDESIYLCATSDISHLSDCIAKNILKELNRSTQINTNVEIASLAQSNTEAQFFGINQGTLVASTNELERIDIIKTLVRELLDLGDPDEEFTYGIMLEWTDIDGTNAVLHYDFYIGKYLASNGDESNRANLNRKMIECLNVGEDCPTTYEYWGPLIYEFLGSSSLAEDDFWWDTELLRRAAFSINFYLWAERLIAQRKAFGQSLKWQEYVKALLSAKASRYSVRLPPENLYLGHELFLKPEPVVNDRRIYRESQFDVYGPPPVPGKTGLLLDYDLETDHAEDFLYRTGFLHQGNTLLFLGPDEASTMLMVLKYCCLMHHRTIRSSWVDEANHPFNPWEDDNLEMSDNYEWDEPHSGKKIPTLEEFVATEHLRLGVNRWDISIYDGDRPVFWGSNIFKVYRVKF